LLEKLEGKNFAFSPTLGHSYCLARIPRYQKIDEAKEVQPIGKHTSTVFLDEVAESNNRNSGVEFSIPLESQAKIVVERHIHHYFKDDLIKRTVLRHLIPIPVNDGSSKVIIDSYTTPLSITKFYEIDDSGEVLCLY
jgi:hypothetical protein